jgi:hypothetical protein
MEILQGVLKYSQQVKGKMQQIVASPYFPSMTRYGLLILLTVQVSQIHDGLTEIRHSLLIDPKCCVIIILILEYGHSSLHAGLDDQRFGGQSKVPGVHLGPHHGNHQNHSDYGPDRRHRIEFLRHRSGQAAAQGDCVPAAGGLAFGRAQFPLRRPGQFNYLRPVVCRRHHLPSISIAVETAMLNDRQVILIKIGNFFYYLHEQVTYQARILTTALFAKILLNQVLPIQKWLSLLLLMSGVILTQVKNNFITRA